MGDSTGSMPGADRPDGRRARLWRRALFSLIAAIAVLAPTTTAATAGQYPSGCSTVATFQTTTGTQRWCWIGQNNVTYDRYSDMTVLAQRILARKGFYTGYIDGDFGGYMTTATQNFQRSRGLLQDGLIGGNTWTRLMHNEITQCGIINHGGADSYGYRIASGEICGIYVQRWGDGRVQTLAYNQNPSTPTSARYVIATLSGPTAI